jgi:hypothetical protein
MYCSLTAHSADTRLLNVLDWDAILLNRQRGQSLRRLAKGPSGTGRHVLRLKEFRVPRSKVRTHDICDTRTMFFFFAQIHSRQSVTVVGGHFAVRMARIRLEAMSRAGPRAFGSQPLVDSRPPLGLR